LRYRTRNSTNRRSAIDDGCLNVDAMVQRCVSIFSTDINTIVYISNDVDVARSLMTKAIARIGRNIFLPSAPIPRDILKITDDPFGAFDRRICSEKSEVILNHNSFSWDIADRLKKQASRMFIGHWGEGLIPE